MAGPASSDVPDRYDVVFSLNDGTTYGFLYADSVESNLPFRTHKAVYSYSPTFLERQNVSNAYGDNFQDFFLTGAQDDFSLGEGQKFFQANDADRSRRYWAGKNIDPLTEPGEVRLTAQTSTVTQASVQAITSVPLGFSSTGAWWMADGTNLYLVDTALAVSSKGAHGAGTINDMVSDLQFVYMAGTTALRKYDGVSFTSFSTTVCNKLVYVNNILYGWKASGDALVSFDTAGNATTQASWKNADGSTGNSPNSVIAMNAYGGVIYLLRRGASRMELWQYTTGGASKLADFSADFFASDMAISAGIVHVSGYLRMINASRFYPLVYYYVGGTVGKLWDSGPNYTSTEPTIGIDAFGDGVVFCDPSNSNSILEYSLSAGGVHTTAQIADPAKQIATANTTAAFMGFNSGVSNKYVYGIGTTYNSSGYLQTSQYTFDNTLTKVFRGIKVDADIPANTSIDLAYQLDGCGGTYTSLATGITSGTEYALPASTTGHSISIQVTLNSSTGSATPVLKRLYVRAAPTLQQFRKREFLFDLAGGLRDELGKASRRTRDNSAYPVDPKTAATNLIKIATQTIPFTVYDRFSAPSGMICLPDLQENSSGYEGFALYDVRPNVLIGRINLREV